MQRDRGTVWNSLAEALNNPEALRHDGAGDGRANAPLSWPELDPESALLLHRGEQNGRVLDPTASQRWVESRSQFAQNEHFVYRDEASQRVVKVTKPGQSGGKGLAAWINNARKANARYGDDIHFVGVIEGRPGVVQIVMSQPFIPQARPATRAEIDWVLYQQGYRRVSDVTYFHPDREEAVSDAKEVNLLWSAVDRQAHPIDVQFFTPSASMVRMWENIINSGMTPCR